MGDLYWEWEIDEEQSNFGLQLVYCVLWSKWLDDTIYNLNQPSKGYLDGTLK